MSDINDTEISQDKKNIVEAIDNIPERSLIGSKDVKKKIFKSPLTKLSIKSDFIKLINQDKDICKYANTLEKENIIFIKCFSSSVASSAVNNIKNNKIFAEHSINELNFEEKTNKKRNDININLFVNNNNYSNEKQIIIVNIKQNNGIMFLESVKNYENLSSDLKKVNISFIFLLIPEMLQDYDIYSLKNWGISTWELDYLFPLMWKCFDKKSDSLYKNICKQREKKLWPTNDSDFYNELNILGLSDDDCSKLEESVEQREKEGSEDKQRTSSLEKERKLLIKPFEEQIPLLKEVLYVAVYFPDLTPREFDSVVRILIKDSNEKISVTKKTILLEYSKLKTIEYLKDKSKKKKKKKKKKKTVEEKYIVDIWENDPDIVRQLSCLVTSENIDDNHHAVNFEYPFLRDKLKEYLEDKRPTFLSRQFNKIYNADLLYSKDERISSSVEKIMMQMAKFDPSYYGEEWLLKKINELQEKTNDSDEFSYLVDRISTLIGEMSKRSSLEDVVENLITRMIASGLSNIVLEICLNLRQVEEFSSLKWINKVLEPNNDDYDADTAIAVISWMLIRSRYSIKEVLESLWNKLPKNKTACQHYKNNQIIIFQAVRGLFIQETINIRLDDYNNKKINHNVFFSLKSEEDIEFIIKYLLHPGFVKFPTYKNNELNIEDMIYYWKGKWLLEFIPFKANDKSRIMGELFDHKILLKVGEVSEKLLTAMIKNDNDLFDDITKSAGKEIYNSLSVDINNYPYAIISQWYILLMINPPDEKISFGKLIVKEMILQSENKKIKKIKDYSRDMIIIYSNLIQSFSRSDLSQKNIRRVSRNLKIQIIMFKYFIKEINKYRLR